MTQGDPLSPTIFNLGVDEVVWYWVEEIIDIVGSQGGSGEEGRHQKDLFYTDDRMIEFKTQDGYRGCSAAW